jgi:hypothetical protein
VRWKSEWTIPSVVGVISFGIGAGVGYAIGTYLKKDKKLDEIGTDVFRLQHALDDQNRQTEVQRQSWDIIAKLESEKENGPPDRVQEVVDSIHASISMEDFEPESDNVFSDDEDDWDYDEELKTRTPETPYIIHRDEYYEEENGYSHSTLTYYAGDDVLVDTDDSPLYNAQQIVGTLIFGKGSGDPSVVHVRNDVLEAEYEVLLDHGYYQVEVLGQEIQDNLSVDKQSLPKFRAE